MCIFLIISAICSLISFFPRLGDKVGNNCLIFLKNKNKREPEDNLLYFGNIKEYSGDTYIKQVSRVYFGENKYNPTKYQMDLSKEIVFNSDIVSRKYKLFTIALYLDIIAFSLLAVSIIIA